jgi:hypothetical protein
MSSFSTEWLSLREPADAAARSARLIHSVSERLPRGREQTVVDLGAGTGSNFRCLAEALGDRQSWLLVDRDRELLGESLASTTSWGQLQGYTVTVVQDGLALTTGSRSLRVATRCLDLALVDEAPALIPQGALVTASALLDLVAESWLSRLATLCRSRGATVLFRLTYDGTFGCSPPEPEDALVRDLVNRHQRRDKGFGPALGPAAIDFAERCFSSSGYHVLREPSDWILSPDADALQRALIDGWADAAIEIAADRGTLITDWRSRRMAHVAARRSTLVVGHQDLAGWIVSDQSSCEL